MKVTIERSADEVLLALEGGGLEWSFVSKAGSLSHAIRDAIRMLAPSSSIPSPALLSFMGPGYEVSKLAKVAWSEEALGILRELGGYSTREVGG